MLTKFKGIDVFQIIKVTAFLLCCAGAALAQGQGVDNGIIVTGEGRVSLPPDMVSISLGVESSGATTSVVLDEVTETAAALQRKLADLGIPETDRQTSAFYLRPLHARRQSLGSPTPEITGYRAGTTLTIRVRDLEASGTLLDAVFEIGVNNFNSLSFGLQDSAEALALARQRAVADARLRAKQLAEAAGLSLGAVVRMSENSHRGGPQVMAMAESRSSVGDAIASGEVDVVAQVTMVFEIAP